MKLDDSDELERAHEVEIITISLCLLNTYYKKYIHKSPRMNFVFNGNK